MLPPSGGSGRGGGRGGMFSGGGFGQSQASAQGFIKPIYSFDIALKKIFGKTQLL
ncbi:MAG: hypothetical protein IPJ81_18730 [Chitinophagaceae bacterium]|nr:hypothetical protein [Chitinophagaceae bacterium]